MQTTSSIAEIEDALIAFGFYTRRFHATKFSVNKHGDSDLFESSSNAKDVFVSAGRFIDVFVFCDFCGGVSKRKSFKWSDLNGIIEYACRLAEESRTCRYCV